MEKGNEEGGLTGAQWHFLESCADMVNQGFAGLQTSRHMPLSDARVVETAGLADSILADCADGDGYIIETRRPRLAWFPTEKGWGLIRKRESDGRVSTAQERQSSTKENG